MNSPDARRRLVAILRLAYSGELAAALAYRGHWRSVRDDSDRRRIREIEEDELRHRAGLRRMLRELGERPSALRDVRSYAIGRVLGALCHVTGFFVPMYAAGKLERRNVDEYASAARYAETCDRKDFVDALLEMADVEWDHEAYFRSRVTSHRWSRWVRLWPPLPPKEGIRSSHARACSRLRSATERTANEAASSLPHAIETLSSR